MTDTYKSSLVLFNERGFVAARQDPAGLSLPQVDVAGGRVGICLSRAVREQLALDIFCLVLPDTVDSSFHIVRLQSSGQPLPSGYVWSDPANLIEHEEIRQAVAAFASIDTEFARFDWYTAVAAWIEERVAELGYATRRLEQWNGRVGGVLLRVLTDGPDFWFKATSDFNTREFSLAQLLAQRHPEYFPRVLAADPSRNAILLEDIDGKELHDCEDLDTWKRVAKLLAELQMEWVGESSRLLAAGAADLRPSEITRKIPAFLDHVAEAMLRQEKLSPPVLRKHDLENLGEELETTCAEVASLPFAEGLANADFSPHNTLIRSNKPVFIDWAEACVSLPLIAGEYMWNRMVVEAPERKPWQDALRRTYLSQWSARYGKEAVDVGAYFLPAFSVLAVAMFYHEREVNGPSPYDAYLRSLARRLQREIDVLSRSETMAPTSKG